MSAATLSSINLPAKCGWSHQYEDVGMAKCFKTALNLVPSHLDVNPDTPEKMIEWARNPLSEHRSKPTFIDPVTYHYIEASRMNNLAWRPGRNFPKRLHQFWLGPKPPPHMPTPVHEETWLEAVVELMELEAVVELMHGQNEHLRSTRDDLLVKLEEQTDTTVASEAALSTLQVEYGHLRSTRDDLLVKLEEQTDTQVASEAALSVLQVEYEHLRSVRDELLVKLEGQKYAQGARVDAGRGLHDDNSTLWEDLTARSNHTRGTPAETGRGLHGGNDTLWEDLTPQDNHMQDYSQESILT